MSGAPNFSESFWRLQELGLTADILPVVWDLAVPVSPKSALRGIGKVPSLINGCGHAIGIPGWTKKQSTAAEVAEWAREHRYGVAIQTRRVRGLDIDVEDADMAEAMAATFEAVLGIELPRRGRENSGKILLAFQMPSPLKKRIVRCGDKGIVELLADGQQFIFHSIHPSGVPYAWIEGLPTEIPEITAEQMESAWAALQTTYSIEPQKSPKLSRQIAPAATGNDPRFNWLKSNWPNHGVGVRGYLNIECPFAEGHSMESGESECVYLPAGTNGYQQGHFKCLHASCANRTHADFDKATGYDRVFEHPNGSLQWPQEIEWDQGGKIKASLNNLTVVLGLAELTGGEFALNEFLGDVFLRNRSEGTAVFFDDDMRSVLRLRLERAGFRKIHTSDLRDAVRIVALGNRYDSAQDWLAGLHWDGTARVEIFLSSYFGVPDTDYARAVSLYLWTALAARVLVPGCQADMVPILVSPEGRHKSRSLQAIAPLFEQFAEIDLQHRDADLSRMMKGKLIGEIAELRGLQQRQVEGIKAFVTRRFEEWTPKYVEKPVRYNRRIVLVGTTNEEQFLGAHTGERRWLPIRIEDGDPDRIARDRDQLWSEAAGLVHLRIVLDQDPVAWEDAFKLGAAEREPFRVEDIYQSKLAKWLDTDGRSAAESGFTTEDALLEAGVQNRGALAEQHRVARALRALGFTQERRRGGGHRRRVWIRAAPLDGGA